MELLDRKFERVTKVIDLEDGDKEEIVSGFKLIEERRVSNTLEIEMVLQALFKGRKDILLNRERVGMMVDVYNTDLQMLIDANESLDLGIKGMPELLDKEELIGDYEEEELSLEEKVNKISEYK